MKGDELFEDVHYSKLFMERTAKQLQSQQYTDVILKADNIEICCHRNILCAGTDYFEVMFNSGFKETDAKVIEIKEVDGDTLKSVIQYIYSSKIKLTYNNVQPIFQAAHMLELKCLTEKCEIVMLEHVMPSNCLGFYQLAQTYSLTRLRDSARLTMLNKFEEVIRSSEYDDLSCYDIIEYISDDDLNVKTENTVFDAISRWINIDPEKRQSSFDKLIEYIRLPHCTAGYLSNVVASSALITQLSQKYVNDAMKYHMTPEYRQQIYSPRTKPRCSFPSKSCIVTFSGVTSNQHMNHECWQYVTESSPPITRNDVAKQMHAASSHARSFGMTNYQRSPVHCMPKRNDRIGTVSASAVGAHTVSASAVVTPTGIFITGGKSREKHAQLLQIKTNQWSPVQSMPQGRYGHGSSFHSNQIYVIGGKVESGQTSNSVSMYSFIEQVWSELPSMRQRLYSPLVASHAQYIFVCSGSLPNDAISVGVVAYDTVWNRWEDRKDMPLQAIQASAVVLNDMLYIVGGKTKSCMRYDTKLDCWTTLTQPQRKHAYGAAIIWQGKILLCGGKEDNNVLDVIEEYNPGNDTWIDSEMKLHKPLAEHCMLVVEV